LSSEVVRDNKVVNLPKTSLMLRRLLIIVPVVLVLILVSLFMPARRASIEGVGTLSFDTTVTLSVGQQTAYASPGWLSGWTYRRAISLSPATSVADYQVLVTLTTGIMGNPYANIKPDGSDIRFTGSDETTLQDYWIESWNNTGTSTIWVEVKTSGTSTIYMYYGNSSASSASNGTATFLFFDDFSSGLSKWNVHIDTDVAITASYGNPAPCLEIGGGFTSSPYGFAAIGSDATYSGFQNGIIEADIYPATVALPEIIFRGNYSANTGYKGRWDCRSETESPWMKPPYSGWGAFGTAVTRFGIANQWQKAKLVINGSTFQIYSNANLKSTVTDTQYSGPGEIGLANHYGVYARFDNVRVRKYASPEPSATVGSEEPDISIPPSTPSSYDFGLVAEGSITDTDLAYFTVTNNSASAVNITIIGTDMTGGVTSWTLSDIAAQGADTYGLKAGLEAGSYNIIVKKTSPNFLVTGLAALTSQGWELQLLAPTSFSDSVAKSATVTLTAILQ